MIDWMNRCDDRSLRPFFYQTHRVKDVQSFAFLKPTLERCEAAAGWRYHNEYVIDRILERKR